MSELSDIQLRIRVEIVNSAAILALVGNMAKVDTATKRVRTTTKAAIGSFSTLGDGFTRTAAAATRTRVATAGLASGQKKLATATTQSGAASKTNIALNARLAKGVQLLTSKVAATSSATSRASKVNRDLATGYQKLTREATNNANATAKAAEKKRVALIRTAAGMKKLADIEKAYHSVSARSSRAFEKVVGQLNRVERKLDAVFRAGVHLQSMGRDLLGFGKKMIGMLSGAADAWGEFEFNLNRAAGAMDVFDNKSVMYQKLKTSVIEMSRELRLVPVADAAKAMYFWQSTTGQTIDTADKLKIAIQGVKTAMQVATLTQTDYEQVIKGAYSIMRQYRLSLSDIPQILKDLFVITQRTSLEYSDLITSFKFTGPIAKMLGGSYKEVAKWLGIIGDLGQRGSISGRGLGMMFTQLVRPSDKAKAAYNKLFKMTLKVKDGYNKLVFPKGKFIGFEKWITLLAKSTSGLNQQQKLQYLTTITGTQNSARIVLPLIDAQNEALKKGVSIFNESKYSMAGSAAVFEKAWGLLSSSWKGVTGLLEQSVMPILLTVGENIAKVLTPVLTELADALWDARGSFEEVAKSVSEAFAPAIAELGKMMSKAIVWFKNNPKIAKQIVMWAAMASIISVVAGAVLLAVGTFLFLFNSIVLIIAGMLPLIAVFVAGAVFVAAFASAVYRNVSGIQEAFGRLGAALMHAFTVLIGSSDDATVSIGGLAAQFQDWMDSVTGALSVIINGIADALERLTPEQAGMVRDIATALARLWLLNKGISIFTGALKMMTGSIWGLTKGIMAALPHIASFIGVFSPSNIKGAILGIRSLGIGIVTQIKAIGLAFKANPVGALITAIIVGIGLLVVAYETNFMGFKDFVDGLVVWFQTNVVPAIAGVFQWLQQVVPPILQGIADFITTVVQPAFNAFVTWIVETFGPMFAQIGDTLAAVGVFFGLLGDKVGEVAGTVSAWLASLGLNFDTNFGGIQLTVEGVTTAILGIIAFFVTAFMNIAGPWLNGLFSVVKIIFESIAKFISGLFRIIEGIFQVFSALLSGNWGLFFEGIGNIVGGFVDTVIAFWGMLFRVVGTFITTGIGVIDGIFKTIFGEGPDSIYSHIKGFLGTILGFAGDIIGGLVKGIGDAIGPAITSVTGFIGDIVDGIKGFLGIKSPATIMLDIGLNIVKGLWKGINDAKDWIIGRITSFVKAVIPQPIQDALGIKSPSRVMAVIGENIVKGLAVGIGRTDDALVAIQNKVSEISAVASSASTGLGGAFSLDQTVSATRKIELEVNVTSSDGSVSGLDMNTLAGLLTGSDMARSLERMASVD